MRPVHHTARLCLLLSFVSVAMVAAQSSNQASSGSSDQTSGSKATSKSQTSSGSTSNAATNDVSQGQSQGQGQGSAAAGTTQTSKTTSAKSSSAGAAAGAPAAAPAAAPQPKYVDNSWKQFPYDKPPKTWQDGQTGTNDCKQWGKSSQESMCQTAVINSVTDFCLWAPPEVGAIGDTEQVEVAWCLKPGYGTRLIPEGTFTGVHFVKTPIYVQVTGVGDLTKINIAAGDEGGELDPHGATGDGNPIGGLVYTNAYGSYEQINEWTNFMSSQEFCFRGCRGINDVSKAQCQHIYDTLGCHWNMPGNYNPGFDSCNGDAGEPMGVYGGTTFHQGDAVTPEAHEPPATSQCTNVDKLQYAFTLPTPPAAPAPPAGNAPVVKNSSSAGSKPSTSSGTSTYGKSSAVSFVSDTAFVSVAAAALASLVGGILVLN